MAQCLMTFGVIGSIEPSSLTTPGGIMHPGLPPHTPYLGTPVVFPPGQRPVSFFHTEVVTVRRSTDQLISLDFPPELCYTRHSF